MKKIDDEDLVDVSGGAGPAGEAGVDDSVGDTDFIANLQSAATGDNDDAGPGGD